MHRIVRMLAIGLCMAFANAAVAADVVPVNTPPAAATPQATYNPLTVSSFTLSLAFMVFGLIVLGLQIASVRRLSKNPDDIAKNAALTVVVVASVVLVVAGYQASEIGPLFGLFGTMVGYVLGKSSRPRDRDRTAASADGSPDPNATP
jgi:hypothetical protein